jgi:phosphatidylglycerol:prolipoprotein diacylglycerol transferase
MFPKIFELKFTNPITSHPMTLGIYSYGLMLALGFIVAGLILKKELKRKQFDENLSNNIVLAAIICGLIGAKVYAVIENWDGFLEHPFSSIFSGSGLVWYGGFFCGVLGVLYVIKKSSAPMLATIDLIGPLLALGYAFGRIGCLLSGDGDYGPPSDLPWAMAFPNGTVPPTHFGFDLHQKLHPTPLYESLMSLTIFFMLWSIRKREYKPGSIFVFYMILAGVERFIAEFWRLTSIVALGLTMAQLISIAIIAGGIYMLLKVRSMEYKYKPTPQKSKGERRRERRR